MTPLSPARRAAEDFAVAVDTRAGSVDVARGDGADRYADLLTCVSMLRAQEIPAPRSDFVADLRMRLMDAADTLLLPAEGRLAPVVPLHVPAASRRQRRISIAAAAFVVIGGTAGVAAAAESALPGDALYPLKKGIESAQVALNSSDSGKGQDMLRQASTRLDEVHGLIAGKQSASEIASTLASFQSSASSAADLLFVAYQRDGNSQDIANLRTMLGAQLAQLNSMSGNAPAGSKSAFDAARSLLTDLDQQASVLCGNCGPGGISDPFSSASSAPSLASLLSVPASDAQQAANQAQLNTDLAHRAGQIAKGSKHSVPNGTGGTTTPVTPTDPTSGLPVPSVGGKGGVGGAVNGLTSGVTTLLNGVGGTTLAPLTGVVDTTLTTLTSGLLGKK